MKKKSNASLKKTERSNFIIKIIMILLFFSGFAVFLYPFLSNAVNNFHDQFVIDKFEKEYSLLNKKQKEERLKKIEIENKKLMAGNKLTNVPGMGLMEDPFSTSPKNNGDVGERYLKKHLFGAVFIPAIKVSLPLFDETNDILLDNGATLLQGSSYPIGGKGTHSVITGHSGLPDKRIFTDLDKLKKGDMFYIDVLGKRLAYRVEKFQVVLPTQLNSLKIVDDLDQVTLVTCTPYMVNTHRLLVTAIRVPYAKRESVKQIDQTKNYLIIRLICFSLMIVLLFILAIYKIKRIFIYYRSATMLYNLAFTVQENQKPLGGVTYYLSKSKVDYKKRNMEGKLYSISDEQGCVSFIDIHGGKYYIYTTSKKTYPVVIGYVKSLKKKNLSFKIKKFKDNKIKIF
ncbi:class C sortase [Lactococcus cremoris]|uniref:class C sortase n=1 Tax=Lactococcus lactis subsp. cremoris TaxID=1359 RepID=UPI00061705D8|nr:class C sortase [Lactococcus cremoris]KZK07893.1 Sortase A LPXTG specific [Lactococcus cremoris]MDU8932195.1 hypothetical protein [Lactococcus cremoris]